MTYVIGLHCHTSYSCVLDVTESTHKNAELAVAFSRLSIINKRVKMVSCLKNEVKKEKKRKKSIPLKIFLFFYSIAIDKTRDASSVCSPLIN